MTAKPSIFLIHPPVAKPCEPPAGIARLAGALRVGGVDCRVFDASLDGILDLLHHPIVADDTWSRRAIKYRDINRKALRAPAL